MNNNQTPPPTPNDHGSDAKSPLHPTHKDAQDHNARQAIPQDPKHQPGHQRQPPGPGQKQ